MKILIVSGFLGAGKTTFIREMAKKTALDLVVMENEYGEVGIDGDLLGGEKKLNIWELTEGCICCSMKSDFASSVLTIANTLDPEYLIVEPTGVGLLSQVVENLRRIEYERILLLKPVTLLDANCFAHYVREYGDIFKDQLRAAGTIVISKRGFPDRGEEADSLLSAVREINPTAAVRLEHYTRAERGWWDALLSTALDGGALPAALQPAAPRLEQLGLSGISLPGPNHLLLFLEELIRGEYGRICRAKGFIDVGAGCCLRFDVVDDRYTVTGFLEAERPKSVFIGNGLKKNRLRRRLLKDYHPDARTIRIGRS